MIEAARQQRELTPDDVLRMGDLADRHEDDDDNAEGPGYASRRQRDAHRAPRRAQGHSAQDAGAGRVPAEDRRRTTSSSASDRPEPARPISPSPPRSTRLARKRVRRIVLARPAVEAGESLGFLPGDMQAKVDPYLRPLYDALDDMMPLERVQRALEKRVDRDRAARVHARPHARRRVRHPRRSAERDDAADEDVAHAARRELQDGDHRRQDAGRPAEARRIGAHAGRAHPAGHRRDRVPLLHGADVVRHRLVRDIVRAYAADSQV